MEAQLLVVFQPVSVAGGVGIAYGVAGGLGWLRVCFGGGAAAGGDRQLLAVVGCRWLRLVLPPAG
ncbi:hypothetical protein QQ045_016159 [Rhodiola kirilowii]